MRFHISLNLSQLTFANSQRFFHQYMLASLQRPEYHISMKIMPCCNQHHINIFIFQHPVIIRSRINCTKLLSNSLRIMPGTAYHRLQRIQLTQLLQIWQVHSLGKTTCPHNSHANFASMRSIRLQLHNGFTSRLTIRIFQKHHQWLWHRRFKPFIRLVRLVNIINLLHHIGKIQLPGLYQCQHFLQVAIFRPAHVSNRILKAFFFIKAVISSRPIRG